MFLLLIFRFTGEDYDVGKWGDVPDCKPEPFDPEKVERFEFVAAERNVIEEQQHAHGEWIRASGYYQLLALYRRRLSFDADGDNEPDNI